MHTASSTVLPPAISAQTNTNPLSLRAGAGQAFEFIWIKPGQFVMGAPPSDKLAEGGGKTAAAGAIRPFCDQQIFEDAA